MNRRQLLSVALMAVLIIFGLIYLKGQPSQVVFAGDSNAPKLPSDDIKLLKESLSKTQLAAIRLEGARAGYDACQKEQQTANSDFQVIYLKILDKNDIKSKEWQIVDFDASGQPVFKRVELGKEKEVTK